MLIGLFISKFGKVCYRILSLWREVKPYSKAASPKIRCAAVVNGCGREDARCEWLDSMIKNLLDARKLRAGHSLKIEFEECDFEMLVQEVVEDLNFAYGERFVVVCDSDIISIPVAQSVIFDC
jgi:hypothetical protein